MKLYTVAETADRLRVSKSVLYKWITNQSTHTCDSTPHIKTVKLGSRVLISEEEIERVIKENLRSNKSLEDKQQ